MARNKLHLLMGTKKLYGRGMPRPKAEVTTARNKLHLLTETKKLYGRGMPRPIAEVTTEPNKLHLLTGRGMPRPYSNCDPNINSSIYRKTKVQQLRFFLPHSKSKQSPPTNLSTPLGSQALIKNQPFHPARKPSRSRNFA